MAAAIQRGGPKNSSHCLAICFGKTGFSSRHSYPAGERTDWAAPGKDERRKHPQTSGKPFPTGKLLCCSLESHPIRAGDMPGTPPAV